MNWYIARFSELRPANVKDSDFEVYILSVETEGFVDSHTCGHQQTEQGCIGVGAESFGRGKLLCSAKELCNLLIAIDVRGLASVAMRK
jgi:hypothetical protein